MSIAPTRIPLRRSLLPRWDGLPAVTLPFIPRDGRRLFSLTFAKRNQGGIGGNKPRGRSVGHQNRLICNGATLRHGAARVTWQGAVTLPSGKAVARGLPCSA